MARDDFSKKTVDILARRVAYTCSNPDCCAPTIGPHSESNKEIIIGVAAHITAAAPGGPRYDVNMDALERASATNGIHLCATCATKIDRDSLQYTTQLLISWKDQAEEQARLKIGKPSPQQPISVPFLEPDLIWQSSGRWHRGYSQQNVVKSVSDPIHIVDAIVHWQVNWDYKMAIYNNSGKMAKNIRIEQINNGGTINIPTLDKVNNLPPYDHLDLNGRFEEWIEGTGKDADALFKHKIPQSLNGMQIKISYQDEFGKAYQTLTTIKDGELETVMQS